MTDPNPAPPVQPTLFDSIALDEEATDLDDTAAEPDDASPDDGDADQDDDDPDDDPEHYTGTCVGGPYNGRAMTSRYESGFLLVDRPRNRAWVYDLANALFTCRDPAGAALDEDGRWKAAEGDTYDVIAYDSDPPQ